MATPPSTERSPSDQVFHLPELLGSILRHVNDVQTLLLSQRVSISFYCVIHDSLPLRRALWLEPTPPADQAEDFPSINPLLAKFHTALNIPTLTTNIDTQDRTSILGRFNYLEIRVVARNDPSSWMRMLPFQTKQPTNFALACPFICEAKEDRENPAKWVKQDEKDGLWLDPEDSAGYVGREVFLTKCTILGDVGTMRVGQMVEMVERGEVREPAVPEYLEAGTEELELEADDEDGEDGGDN